MSVFVEALEDGCDRITRFFHLCHDLVVDGDFVEIDYDSFGNVDVSLIELEPRMAFDLRDRVPRFRIDVQDPSNQVARFMRYKGGNRVLSLNYLLVQDLGVIVVKGEIPTEQSEENHPRGPNVHGKSLIFESFDHLRSSVARRAAGSTETRLVLIEIRETEVHYFDVHLRVDQEVLGLEVSMNDVQLMNILDSI